MRRRTATGRIPPRPLALLAFEILAALLARFERFRTRVRTALGLAPRPSPLAADSPLRAVLARASPVPAAVVGSSVTGAAMRTRAFGAERAARLEAAARTLRAAFPYPGAEGLDAAILPDNWGSVREVFGALKKAGEGGIAAVPTIAAWLKVAPTRIGHAKGYLTGWEAYALADAWSALGPLQKDARRVADHVGPGAVADALAAVLEVCDVDLVELAVGVLLGADSQAQRGAVSFLQTSVGAADRARAALLAFAQSPAPADEAGLGYARGEAIRAYTELERYATPPAEREDGSAVEPRSPPTSAQPEAGSWSARLAAFRRLASEGDLAAARDEARALLVAGTPFSPAGESLRAAAVEVLSRPWPPPPAPVVPARYAASAPSTWPGDASDDEGWDDDGPAEPARATSPHEQAVRLRLDRLAGPGQPVAVRVQALESLARRGAADEAFLELLFAAAEDESPELREAAARLLAEV